MLYFPGAGEGFKLSHILLYPLFLPRFLKFLEEKQKDPIVTSVCALLITISQYLKYYMLALEKKTASNRLRKYKWSNVVFFSSNFLIILLNAFFPLNLLDHQHIRSEHILIHNRKSGGGRTTGWPNPIIMREASEHQRGSCFEIM